MQSCSWHEHSDPSYQIAAFLFWICCLSLLGSNLVSLFSSKLIWEAHKKLSMGGKNYNKNGRWSHFRGTYPGTFYEKISFSSISEIYCCGRFLLKLTVAFRLRRSISYFCIYGRKLLTSLITLTQTMPIPSFTKDLQYFWRWCKWCYCVTIRWYVTALWLSKVIKQLFTYVSFLK